MATMPVDIVPIEESHIDGFHRALDFVAREHRYLAFLEAPPPESTRAFVLDNIKRGHPQFVALTAGEVVGWCDVVAKGRPIHAHTGVLGVALLPPFRGQGIGADLIRHALAAAKAFGFHRVELTVREDNTNAIALYRKFGFVTEGVQRDAVRVDGVYGNVMMMAVLF
jgi:ribosomal protein S18 acetylase RimI-like enzyme